MGWRIPNLQTGEEETELRLASAKGQLGQILEALQRATVCGARYSALLARASDADSDVRSRVEITSGEGEPEEAEEAEEWAEAARATQERTAQEAREAPRSARGALEAKTCNSC